MTASKNAFITETAGGYPVRALHTASSRYRWLTGAMVVNLDSAAAGDSQGSSERYRFSLLSADRTPPLPLTRLP